MSQAPLLLIVGMHRSGTSLLGSLLSACGIAMPGLLIPGDEHNPEGYFERADVTALQEQLLVDLHRWWPSPHGMLPLPPDWLGSSSGQDALARLIALLEVETHSGPWAIKDPRSSLLLPLWQAACVHLSIPLQLVLAVRDPAEVVVSLVQRDHAATGMDAWRAQRLWWHHNRSVICNGCDLPLRVVHYSHWFDSRRGLQQLTALAPHLDQADIRSILASVVKPQHRRSHRLAASCRLSSQLKSLDRRLQALALNPRQREPLQHWLARQFDPPALAPPRRRRGAIKRVVQRWCGRPALNCVASHPWGYLVEMVCGSQGPEAEHQLAIWLEHGFSVEDCCWIAALPGSHPPAAVWQAKTSTVVIQVRGGDLHRWSTHVWAQHCPIQAARSLQLEPLGECQTSTVAINLADVEPGAVGGRELLQLAALERVWDPNPVRVQLLRQFGVNASCLHPGRSINSYLQPGAGTWGRCSEQLGLVAPALLAQLGTTLCLGTGGSDLDLSPQSPLLGVPGFDALSLHSPEQAWLLAAWLQGCLEAGLEIVRFCTGGVAENRADWGALVQEQAPGRAPILLFDSPLGNAELRAELDSYRQGPLLRDGFITPIPGVQLLFEREAAGSCQWAVCIRLHNHASSIVDALQSVLRQHACESVELIVLDDASADDGFDQVLQWMQRHQHQVGRCVLLQHTHHGGLAAAWNTAFAAAKSPWCFALDATHTLLPKALAHCAALAEQAGDRCAVVRCLTHIAAEHGGHPTRSLLSDRPWHQALLDHGNTFDGMVLVRRDAWSAVGGFVHAVEGWEDVDFWCTLTENDWHAILCPEVLVTSNGQARVMSRCASRLLNSRHPWLHVPLGHDRAIWPPLTQR